MRITEQTKKENRARVLEKAIELFINKGFEDTTTRDIALTTELPAGKLIE